ncbi:MAG: DUF1697 domain-containing protein [Roseiflexaceae bacterium]|nr:DUF1697 domain-containing protein [Roseiflexaceae bacterium]
MSIQPLRYIAFLRAINVGGHTVKMEHLRWLFADIGFANVESFIASGNLIFDWPACDTAALEQQIDHYLHQALGYPVATFLRSPAEIAAVAAYQPFPHEPMAATDTLFVAFLARPPSDKAQARLLALQTPLDEFRVHGREAYWRRRGTPSQSAITGAQLERALELPATQRNITTVRKLAAKYGPEG